MDIKNLEMRAVNAFAVFTNLLFMCLLNIETLSIFRVLNPALSDRYLIIPRTALMVSYLVFAGINAAHYALEQDEGLDYMAKIARLMYIGVIALFLQALFIYWFYLVRTTLKRQPSKEIQTLLNRAQICVVIVCFFCISGGAAYGMYEASPFESPYKAPTLVYTIVCCGSGVVDQFILFLTMIRIKLTETKKPKKKQAQETMLRPETVDLTIQDRARGDTKIME
jgi:hypothetical protein